MLCFVATCRSDVPSNVNSGNPPQTQVTVTGIVATAGSGSDLPRLVEHGGLSFEILDDATGQRMPGKLTILGLKGTPDPKLSKGDIGTEDDTSMTAYNRVFSLGGVGVVPVPTGTYDVTFSRGLEWTITVRAAPWVSVSRVMLYIAGHEVMRWEVPAGEQVERFHASYPLAVANDTYALVRVEGDHSLAPVVGGGSGVSVMPFALTNPIFLDANGNGTYDPAFPHGAHASE